jgi:SH3 domain-containing YSC84-like protein 1
MRKLVVAMVAAAAAGGGAHAAISSGESQRLAAAARVLQEIQPTIPAAHWRNARCVAVFPDLKKVGFVGGEGGKGVMSCRGGMRWSAPVFAKLANGTWRRAGPGQMDVVLLVMNQQGAQRLLQDKVTLGADSSVAPGPVVGRGGIVADTDVPVSVEMLSYARAAGFPFDLDLAGEVLKPDDDANKDVYGSRSSSRTILATSDLSAPTQAHAFVSALNAPSVSVAPAGRSQASTRSGVVGTTGQSSTPPSRALTTTDDDLRARVVDIQQTLDRMLADTTPSPVATTGTANERGATVTVDRERLLQMRQQLEALLTAMSRR